MSIYGRMVAAGEWRDYGISGQREVVIFSIFRRTAEHALYRIGKRPKLAAKQGMYSVVRMDGRIIKRLRIQPVSATPALTYVMGTGIPRFFVDGY